MSSTLGRFQLCCQRFRLSCGARRMAESAALLVDEAPPEQPMLSAGVCASRFSCVSVWGRLCEGAESLR